MIPAVDKRSTGSSHHPHQIVATAGIGDVKPAIEDIPGRIIPRDTRTLPTRGVRAWGCPPAPFGEEARQSGTDDSDVGNRDATAERR